MTSSPFLKALAGANTGRPPVWLMRQAGRYLPEYRAVRQRYSFEQMCQTPELMTEVTLMPVKRFGVDAAVMFSDILVVLEVLGRPARIVDGIGPVIDHPVREAKAVAQLPSKDVCETLAYVAEGIRLLRSELNVPLIGFCGGPFTVASYLIEGGSTKDFSQTKSWLYRDPSGFNDLLERLSDVSIEYLKMQIEAGVQAVQIFDSWASVLAYPQFQTYAQRHLKRLVDAVKSHQIPVILFSRQTASVISQLADLKPSGVSVDWTCCLPDVRKNLSPQMALQGNLDPQVLHAPVDVVRQEARRLLEEMAGDPAYIFGLGHGVLPKTPLESVEALIETVHTLPCGV